MPRSLSRWIGRSVLIQSTPPSRRRPLALDPRVYPWAGLGSGSRLSSKAAQKLGARLARTNRARTPRLDRRLSIQGQAQRRRGPRSGPDPGTRLQWLHSTRGRQHQDIWAPSHATEGHHGGHRASQAALIIGAAGRGVWRCWHEPALHLERVLACGGGFSDHPGGSLRHPLSDVLGGMIMVVTVKYLTVMRADNKGGGGGGGGGIFALLAIVPGRFRTGAAQGGKVTGMALLAVIGASLLYGDGVITPAISVVEVRWQGPCGGQSSALAARLAAHLRHSDRPLCDPAARRRTSAKSSAR